LNDIPTFDMTPNMIEWHSNIWYDTKCDWTTFQHLIWHQI